MNEGEERVASKAKARKENAVGFTNVPRIHLRCASSGTTHIFYYIGECSKLTKPTQKL